MNPIKHYRNLSNLGLLGPEQTFQQPSIPLGVIHTTQINEKEYFVDKRGKKLSKVRVPSFEHIVLSTQPRGRGQWKGIIQLNTQNPMSLSLILDGLLVH